MKILYHHRTMGRGAEGVHIVSMVKAFEQLGNQVKIISPPSVDPLREAGKSVFQVDSKNIQGIALLWRRINLLVRSYPQFVFEAFELIYNIYAFFAVWIVAKQFDPDLYYERYAFLSLLGGLNAKRKRIPYVLEVNEISGLMRFRMQFAVKFTGWIEKKYLIMLIGLLLFRVS